MSVLESLYIQVKLETDQLKKGLSDAQSQVEKLESGFEKLSKSGDKAAVSFDDVLRSSVKMFAGFASFNAILSGARGTIQAITDVGQASKNLSVDVSALDAWDNAVKRAGGSAAGFQSSLQSLAQHFGTSNEIALKALPRLADAFSRLNDTQAQRYGKSLGIDQATILLLQQGRREVEATIQQQMKFGVVTKAQTETTDKFNLALGSLSRVYEDIQRQSTISALPLLTESLEYLVNHKDLVIGALIGIGAAVATMGASFLIANPALIAAAGAISTIAVFYEDYKAFSKGEESGIGTIRDEGKKDQKRFENFVSHVSPDFLSDQSLDAFSRKYLHLPEFLGGQGYGGGSSAPVSVTVGDININTQATDADGMALHAGESLKKQISHAMSQVDNGVHK